LFSSENDKRWPHKQNENMTAKPHALRIMFCVILSGGECLAADNAQFISELPASDRRVANSRTNSMSSAIIHPYTDANPESEQIIFNNFAGFFAGIHFLDTQKTSCIVWPDAYDGARLRQMFLMIHRNAGSRTLRETMSRERHAESELNRTSDRLFEIPSQEKFIPRCRQRPATGISRGPFSHFQRRCGT
jgi:hypothetical protein